MSLLKEEQRTMPKLLQRAVDIYGDAVAIKEEQSTISWRELQAAAFQASRAFLASGIEKGDRVAVWAPNISEWIVATLGLECIGGVLVPLNTRMKGSEAAYILNKSGAKMLFTVNGFLGINYAASLSDQDLPELQDIVVMMGDVENNLAWEDFLLRGDTIDQARVDEIAAAITGDDIMDMLFTSGTTGKPKGVLCAHSQNIHTVESWAETNGLHSDDNYLIINPFFHSFGYKAGWLACLITGAKILPVLTFDLDKVLQQISDDKVSMLPGPPTIYQSILAHPKRNEYDLSSLRLAVTGAAPVPVELINRMRKELGFESIVTAYGLTETCGFVSICRPDDAPEVISGSSGRAMEGVEVKIAAPDGSEMPRGENGEIWVRGYNVMKGYFDNEAATREAITDDGWLKTGDIGVMDDNGYIDITDRMKDMYISGGFNVYPAEVENGVSSIPGVSQAAVIGVPDERMGEVGKVFIVTEGDAKLTEEEVIAWCKNHMANYKVPRYVAFLDAMPLNASGKILKTELRSL